MSLFAILAVSVALIAASILRAGLRAQTQAKVRTEGAYAMAAMSDISRYAVSATNVLPQGTGIDVRQQVVINQVTRFRCTADHSISQNGVKLISDEVVTNSCSISHDSANNEVTIDFSLVDKNSLLLAPVNFYAKIVLRNKQ